VLVPVKGGRLRPSRSDAVGALDAVGPCKTISGRGSLGESLVPDGVMRGAGGRSTLGRPVAVSGAAGGPAGAARPARRLDPIEPNSAAVHELCSQHDGVKILLVDWRASRRRHRREWCCTLT